MAQLTDDAKKQSNLPKNAVEFYLYKPARNTVNNLGNQFKKDFIKMLSKRTKVKSRSCGKF